MNAGNNTLSMFAIDAKDPTKLTLVGSPAAVPGDFPNTVGASAKNGLVCVGTTGVKAGITCASFSDNSSGKNSTGGGLGSFDALRPFNLGQQNPPAGPTDTISQVFFSEDEDFVYATLKSDGVANSTHPGGLALFPVVSDDPGSSCPTAALGGSRGKANTSVAVEGTLSTPAGSAVLFGAQPIPGTGGKKVFVVDASFGAGILSVDKTTGAATFSARTAIPGQKASCWGALSAFTGTAFVADGGQDRLVELSTADASVVATYDLSNSTTDPGLFDLAAAGRFVYTLSPGNGSTPAAVTVLDVSGGPGTGKLAQHFQIGTLGAGKNAQGVAILLS